VPAAVHNSLSEDGLHAYDPPLVSVDPRVT
jgi:hypothetical protein